LIGQFPLHWNSKEAVKSQFEGDEYGEAVNKGDSVWLAGIGHGL
jgi:hypothetical protein